MKTNQRLVVLAALLLAIALASIPGAALAAMTGNTGLGQSFDTMQPSLAMNYLVSLTGVFPSPEGPFPSGQFLGQVVPFAGNRTPGGWAVASGQLLSINQNIALFSVLGTTYGGDGSTTFALPDLRGRSAIGIGQGAGLTNRLLGDATGVSQRALTDAQMPAHAHALPGDVTGSEGGSQPFTNMKPSLALNYSINLQGFFPQRENGTTGFPILGQLNLFAGNYSIGGSTGASGQLMPINQNQALFSLLGTMYGGNGQTTFALPDLRGRTPVSAGQGPGLASRILGDEIGSEQTSLTVGQLPAHVHALPGGGDTGIVGNGQPIENGEPSLALHYMIAVNAICPPDVPFIDEPFLGEIGLFAGTFAPGGWMFAEGQLLSITENSTLFSLLGNMYGGDGITNFALPDLRGRTIIGAGQGPGLPNWNIGQYDGADLLTLSTAQLPEHNHTIPVPEPSGIALILLGAASLAAVGWRRIA